jgi:hypothetical protein
MVRSPGKLFKEFESPISEVSRVEGAELPLLTSFVAKDTFDASRKDSLKARGKLSPACAGKESLIILELRIGISTKVAWTITPNYKHLADQIETAARGQTHAANLHEINGCGQDRVRISQPHAQSRQVLPICR